MRIITLVIGKKGAGKSKWILEKKDQMLSEGWEKIDAINESDRNTAIFVLKSPIGEVAILNSGSDMHSIIKDFGAFLSRHTEVSQIFTAIRPQKVNPRLYLWMKRELNNKEGDVVKRIEL